MKRAQVATGNGLQSVAEAVNRRQDPRPPVEFGLMYSAQDRSGEILMGDGMVTDLSHHGIRAFAATPRSRQGWNSRFSSTSQTEKTRCS